ncbi:M1 family metallopeptidase [Aquimarina agarilytica]|uniref:M1 family metallopeptidase n=1 Tax=Aquimarina agarilytica TaxID=1087449 RepID=UPI0002884E08|nr:M1 family metallopeptidase [Aquimarina agarilytica]
MSKNKLLFLAFISTFIALAQPHPSYWQQQANYKMDVDVNVKNYTYTGEQTITYTNNSPDTLHHIYYHLYFNAFQPGSEMDIRNQHLKDSDKRVKGRINKLKQNEIGFLKVNSLFQNDKKLDYSVAGTILEVNLQTPILPGQTSTFKMDFTGQIPKQIRRSGRNNAEGVALSMTQWYPKLVEYDIEGWHADPYIGREFHGVWGNYDVHININGKYTVAGSGVLQNPDDIGHGYSTTVKEKNSKKLNWHFIANNVHDFAWAADPEYMHDFLPLDGNKKLHFFYKNDKDIIANWKKLQPVAKQLLTYYETHIGPYPYPQYSIIQGGDGGMEYAMCTLITGERKFGSLVGVTAHEMAHAWFQHILATNESKNEWMDEGFTTYISNLAENEVLQNNQSFPNEGSYKSYQKLVESGLEQPQTTHSDRYSYNFAYGVSAYSKGAIFMEQLGYIVGQENLAKIIKEYYTHWKFKHPNPNDFKRIAEKISDMQLDWYLTDWTKTTNTIDYGITTVEKKKKNTQITLERVGLMPMPVEVLITFEDNTTQLFYIPLQMMRGQKPVAKTTTILKDWAWAFPTYSFSVNNGKKAIQSIKLNATKKMADVNKANDLFNLNN